MAKAKPKLLVVRLVDKVRMCGGLYEAHFMTNKGKVALVMSREQTAELERQVAVRLNAFAVAGEAV